MDKWRRCREPSGIMVIFLCLSLLKPRVRHSSQNKFFRSSTAPDPAPYSKGPRRTPPPGIQIGRQAYYRLWNPRSGEPAPIPLQRSEKHLESNRPNRYPQTRNCGSNSLPEERTHHVIKEEKKKVWM